MKVDRSRTIGVERPRRLASAAVLPRDYGQECFAFATVRGACSDWRARSANSVSHLQISHWGEPNVDTMPLPLKLNSLINEFESASVAARHKSRLTVRAGKRNSTAHAHDRKW